MFFGTEWRRPWQVWAVGLLLSLPAATRLAAQQPESTTQSPGEAEWRVGLIPRPPADLPPGLAALNGQDYTVPAGTKVLLSLKSAVNTKSARPGDGVYLVSTFPVIVGSHVLIPVGVYVQGVVDQVQRPGRGEGKSQAADALHHHDLSQRAGGTDSGYGESATGIEWTDGEEQRGRDRAGRQQGP